MAREMKRSLVPVQIPEAVVVFAGAHGRCPSRQNGEDDVNVRSTTENAVLGRCATSI